MTVEHKAGDPYPIIEVDDRFVTIKDHRGVHPIKQYLHRWVKFNGEDWFIKYRRKHNRTYEEVAHHQHVVDLMKPLFGLNQIGTLLVHDPVEGIGVMQRWHRVIGTVKQRPFMAQWASEAAFLELLKVCVFDGVIGGLDRHGNNVIVLRDKRLLTIDDEDVFYDKMRVWVKFDKDIRGRIYMAYMRNQEWFAKYLAVLEQAAPKMREIADCPVMKGTPEYPFFAIFDRNTRRIREIAKDTIVQLLH